MAIVDSEVWGTSTEALTAVARAPSGACLACQTGRPGRRLEGMQRLRDIQNGQ